MAENIHIDLSEKIEQDIEKRYQDVCDALTEELNIMVQNLENICNETSYAPMVKCVNETVQLFDEDIYQLAKNVFEEWIDGNASFSAAVQTSQAGDAAQETARAIDGNIQDMFDNFWSSHPLGDAIQIDTSRPKVKAEDFDELKDIYTKAFENIESINEDSINQIVEQGEDNPTYNIIIPAIKAITETIKNAFGEFGKIIDDAKETSEKLKQTQDSYNVEAWGNATKTSATAVDIADAVKMFDDI